jgi:hypothetical protein
MSSQFKDKFQSLIDQRNEPELVRRRDYHEYLVKMRRTGGQTVEEFVAQFADLVRYGVPATEAELAALTERIGATLPDELAKFYRELGSLHDQLIRIYSPAQLLAYLSDDAAPCEHLDGIGITHMMRHAWGNDRWEFDAKEGLLSQAEMDGLNSRYRCIGVLSTDYCESHTYLYFDKAGRFGTIEYHQDAFDDLLQNTLRPMLVESPAALRLEDAVLDWLAQPPDEEED